MGLLPLEDTVTTSAAVQEFTADHALVSTAEPSPRALESGPRESGPSESGPSESGPREPASLERARRLVLPATRAAVARLEPDLARVVGYHLGWIDAAGSAASGSSGKALRPALALLSAQAAGADAAVGVPAAVAVELVHNFSLLHDDVMDADTERRHRPTAWSVFGVGPAILAGDALLGLAMEVLLERVAPGEANSLGGGNGSGEALDLGGGNGRLGADRDLTAARAAVALAKATGKLIAGQSQDLAFERRQAVAPDEYLVMAAGKTAALLACACSLGAVLAAGSDELVGHLEAFGWHIGLAFQAIDDLLGIWGHPQVTGKPVGNDLRQRKKTLPVAVALTHGGRSAVALARLLAGGVNDDEEVALATKLITQAGGRDATTAEADHQLHLALAQLDAAAGGTTTGMSTGGMNTGAMSAQVHRELVELAHFTTRRER